MPKDESVPKPVAVVKKTESDYAAADKKMAEDLVKERKDRQL